jgi:RNA polymerase-interacting CarD/CdnL/TRCF family regulator
MAKPKDGGYKKGDVLIGQGTVFKVIKIEKRKNMEGEEVDYLVYEPFFKTKRTKTLRCSMPVANVEKTAKRSLVSKKELKDLLHALEEVEKGYESPSPNEVTEVINGVELSQRLAILKRMWLDKHDPDVKLSISKIGSFKKIFLQASQEVAAVLGKSLEEAEEVLKKRLTKAIPEEFKAKK